MPLPVAVTIAGSDSGGGAGIQADIKSMQANGVFAASVIAAVTAQNTVEVKEAFDLPVGLIEAQMDAVYEDFDVAATKTGMLSSPGIIEAVVRKMDQWKITPLVVDPVMISRSGFVLLKEDAIESLRTLLIPRATLVTPNAHEAGHLAGLDVDSVAAAQRAAQAIFDMGPQAVLVKGGHFTGQKEATDVYYDGTTFEHFSAPFIDTPHTHGTGCTYASAIAAHLARGCDLRNAIERSKKYVTEAIRHGMALGKGNGPTHHFYFLSDTTP